MMVLLALFSAPILGVIGLTVTLLAGVGVLITLLVVTAVQGRRQ